jgi:hypothetical protein
VEEIPMTIEHPYQPYYQKLKPALKNKAEELKILGLGDIKEDEIWLYLTRKKWKRPQDEIHLYELVNDVLTFSSSHFMTFVTIEAYKEPSLLGPLSSKEMKELFKD